MVFLESVCERSVVLQIVEVISNVITLISRIAPIVLILMLVIDFGKAVISGDESAMKKSTSLVIKRIIYCVLIFCVPYIIDISMNLLGNLGVNLASCYTGATAENIARLKEKEANERKAIASNRKNGTVTIKNSDNNNGSNDNNGDGGNDAGGNSGGGDTNYTGAPATSIKLSKSSLSLYDEESYTLSVTTTPNGTSGDVAWRSNNATVATVNSKGVVQAKSVGTAIIIAYSKSNSSVSVSCKVTVRKIRMLFVGNSYTFLQPNNGVPGGIVSIGEKQGYSIEYKAAYKSGSRLLTIYNHGNNASKIDNSFDYVILQPYYNLEDSKSDNKKGAMKIIEVVKKKNPNVKIYIRRVWETKKTSKNKLEKNNNNYVSLASELEKKYNIKIGLINDGSSMYDALWNYKINVFAVDEYHQSEKGVYLIDYCIFSTVFHYDPSNFSNFQINNYSKLTDSEAASFRKIAKSHCYS